MRQSLSSFDDVQLATLLQRAGAGEATTAAPAHSPPHVAKLPAPAQMAARKSVPTLLERVQAIPEPQSSSLGGALRELLAAFGGLLSVPIVVADADGLPLDSVGELPGAVMSVGADAFTTIRDTSATTRAAVTALRIEHSGAPFVVFFFEQAGPIFLVGMALREDIVTVQIGVAKRLYNAVTSRLPPSLSSSRPAAPPIHELAGAPQ